MLRALAPLGILGIHQRIATQSRGATRAVETQDHPRTGENGPVRGERGYDTFAASASSIHQSGRHLDVNHDSVITDYLAIGNS